MARVQVATSCTLLGLTLLGFGMAMAGVNSGWASGAAHDIHPQGGGWGPIPWGPTGDLTVQLGWWNATITVKSSLSDYEITDTTASARALGVTAVTLYSVAALLALSLACLVLAHSGEVRLPLLRQLKLGACGISFDSSDDMAACAAWAQNISGAATLLLATTLYVALAIGAHQAVRDKSEQLGQDISLWPYPSWAFCGALMAGCCQIATGRVFQGALAGAGHAYEPML